MYITDIRSQKGNKIRGILYKHFIIIFLFFLFSQRLSKTHPGSVVHLSDNPLDSNKVSRKASSARYLKGAENSIHYIHLTLSSISSFFVQVLIGYELGLITLWDMKGKCAELR